MGPDTHPNAVLTRRLYELIGHGDRTGCLDLIADDAVFHIGGDSIVARRASRQGRHHQARHARV
ncbi:hypothetical protein [Nonomuraea sp. NPDC050202]|uniref:hypothetical protein n=1 Tax=Nonomuraea sp. NPDC050202 TaxID=3155035 RepID=UPI0033F6A3CF